jgi:Flp pilus assembly protein TadD
MDCPEVPMLEYLVARLAFRVENYPLAYEAILAALKKWPDEARWHALASAIYLDAAPDEVTAVIADRSEDLQARALEHLEQAVALEPDNASHHLRLGQIYRQTGAVQRAVLAFEQAARLAPDLPEPWFELAQTQLGNGDLQAADASAARSLAHNPDDLDVLMLNASIALERENLNGALRHLKAVLRLKADHPEALKMLSRVLEGLGRTDEALEILEKTLPLFGNPLELQLQQTRLLYRARGADAAMLRLQNLVDRYPHEPELLATQAEWLFQNGESKLAIERARAALSQDRGKLSGRRRADLYYLIGLQARQDGQLDQAVHVLSEAVATAPDHLEALLALGRTHQSRRELHQAWRVYQHAVDLTPRDYRPYYYAGQVLKDLKDYVQAEKMLRHAAQLAPDEVLVHRLLGAVTVLNLVHNRPAMTTESKP